MVAWIERSMEEMTDRIMDEGIDGWMDKWTDAGTDKWLNGWTNKRIDNRRMKQLLKCCNLFPAAAPSSTRFLFSLCAETQEVTRGQTIESRQSG